MTDREIDDMRTGKADTIGETVPETTIDLQVDPAAEADHPKGHNADLEGAPHHTR